MNGFAGSDSRLKAAEIRNKIAAEMKAGKSFADAAQAAAGVETGGFHAV